MHSQREPLQLDVSTTPHRNRIALIPAFNEVRFIGSVILRAQAHVERVLVVDDGSTDGTARVASSAGAEVLTLPHNTGKANAVSEGMRCVRGWQPTAVVLLDGDGQHDPDQIPSVLAPIENGEADLVIGSRFSGRKNDIPRWRIFGQHALTLATNVASGITVRDSQSGFRAFSPRIISHLDFSTEGFSLESEMQFIARRHDLTLVEVPISTIYQDRPKRNPITHGLQVLNGILRLIGQNRPLLFLGVPGLSLLVMGLLMGVWVVRIYDRTFQLAVGYALISVLLCIMGGIGLSTGITLHSIRAWLLEWARESQKSEKSK